MKTKKQYPQRIKEIRRGLKTNQKEFAKKLGISISLLQALEQGQRSLTGDVASKIYILTGENPGWTGKQLRAFRCGQREVLRGDEVSTDPKASAKYFGYLLELLFSAASRYGEPTRMEQVGRQLSCDLHDLALQYDLGSAIKTEIQRRLSPMVIHPFYGKYIEEIDQKWKWLFHQAPEEATAKPTVKPASK